MDYFVYSVLQNVFQNDARNATRPMTHYVDDPDDIDNLFDSVAYDKCNYHEIIRFHELKVLFYSR